MNLSKKISIIILCVITSAILLCSCSNKSDNNTAPEQKKQTYTFAIIQPQQNDYYNYLTQGISDGLTDYFTNANINLNIKVLDENSDLEQVSSELVTNGSQLIFTEDEATLLSVASKTNATPIVASNIVDYENVLGINTSETEWDRSTGRNITGSSSLPHMQDMVSLIIEATPELESVGILTNPADRVGIYQNQIIEKYLTEAGISWKEYELKTSEELKATKKDYNRNMLQTACDECSVLYLSSNSILTDQAPLINSVSTKNNVPTVGGDQTIGKNTLVSMFYDPHETGYNLASIAYKIIKNETKPEKISIKYHGSLDGQKLYEGSIASKLNRSFPKSFKEINSFLSSYEPKTKRNVKE